MKIQYPLLVGLIGLSISCNPKSDSHAGHSMSNEGGSNQALYNQVMDIHDEVMPATEDLYNISKGLKARLKETTDEAIKADLEQKIEYVDSVNTMMMDWMRKFKPQPDSVNEETARAYYESELEKIKKVKEAMLTTLDKFGAANQK